MNRLDTLISEYDTKPRLNANYKKTEVDLEDIVRVGMTDAEAVDEATRCMKCVDAPCRKACPSHVDVKRFMQCISTNNTYGAAKAILSDNPLGWSCGHICPSSELCAGACNLRKTGAGAIKIRELQQYAISKYAASKVNVKVPAANNKSVTKIALIGAGPSSLSCATFLARLGFKDITVFEKNNIAGGVLANEVPSSRLPQDVIAYEVATAAALGVKFKFGVSYPADLSIESLKNDGYQAIFFGVGLQDPRSDDVFRGKNNVYDAQAFLRMYKNGKAPKLSGHVTVIGVGDTAMDCVTAAYGCGAKNVTCVFRRGFPQMKAGGEEFDESRHKGCDFISWSRPTKVIEHADGCVLECVHTTLVNDKVTDVPNTVITIPCTTIITAFGSRLATDLHLPVADGVIKTEAGTRRVTSGVYAGGDAIGHTLAVEAVNDGKTAASNIYVDIMNEECVLPEHSTDVDDISLRVKCCGQTYKNPFGLASAPPATTGGMIARAFEYGWGFAVTKTYQPDKNIPTNLSPRIGSPISLKADNTPSTFLNIEQTSDKTATYWIKCIKELKAKYPDNIVIASIMATENEKDWTELVTQTIAVKPDALELNLSCPTGVHERGLGIAIGQKPDAVANVCRWVKAAAHGVPFYVKLTPNITDIRVIADAAIKAGASGVTAINTVNAMLGLDPLGYGWPRVNNNTSYGGMSGRSIRPMALHAISKIANFIPGAQICATGGCESGETASMFIRCGAPIIQISSALHSTDFSLIYDLTTGLKSVIYEAHKVDPTVTDCQSLVGHSLGRIVDFGKMDLKSQSIAAIDLDECLHCGKCYGTCGDCGYQAVSFDNHVPVIDAKKCTGCGLCYAVCPSKCIKMIAKQGPLYVDRGDRIDEIK